MAQHALSHRHSMVIARLRSHTMVPSSATEVAPWSLPLRWHYNMITATEVAPLKWLARLSQCDSHDQATVTDAASHISFYDILLKRSQPYVDLSFQPETGRAWYGTDDICQNYFLFCTHKYPSLSFGSLGTQQLS